MRARVLFLQAGRLLLLLLLPQIHEDMLATRRYAVGRFMGPHLPACGKPAGLNALASRWYSALGNLPILNNCNAKCFVWVHQTRAWQDRTVIRMGNTNRPVSQGRVSGDLEDGGSIFGFGEERAGLGCCICNWADYCSR